MPTSSKRTYYVERAKRRIVEVLGEIEVAYDRELRYRLEGEFAHDITWRAINELRRCGEVKEFGLPGRKKKEGEEEVVPSRFYTLPELWDGRRRKLERKARKKRELVALGVAALSEAGRYAEELFWMGLRELAEERGWEVFPEGVDDVGKDVPKKILKQRVGWVKKAIQRAPDEIRRIVNDVLSGKMKEDLLLRGGDFDMVLRVGEGEVFGVEIKNGLSYPKLYGKLLAISRLGMLPLLITRWLSLSQLMVLPGGREGNPYGVVVFKRAVFPPTYKYLADRLSEEVGWPVEARGSVDIDWLRRKVGAAIEMVLEHREEVVDFQRGILELEFKMSRVRSALDAG